MLTRPKITEEVLKQIRQTIKANPEWNRTRISKYLCELWDWRVPGGQIKDISCRDMLRALDKVGEIQLPESKYSHEKRHWRKPKQINHESKPITCALSKLQPLIVEVIEGGTALAGFKSLIDQYHYLGFGRTVGENMKYMIRGKDGAPLACLLFGSAAWKCRDRDAYIGWDRERRGARLMMLTSNTRFLILPWITIPHLASHVLSIVTRRLSADWQMKYGHPIILLETFVEFERFRGTCYRAANWICVGRTTGRGRDDRQHEQALPQKDIYLYPLTRLWRKSLISE